MIFSSYMKISLLYPSWTGEYGNISLFARKAAGSYPPLNLAYLASIAEKQGHDVRIIDGESEGMPIEQMADRTIEFNPDIVGITATTPFYHISENLAKGLKQKNKDIRTAIGGQHITVLREAVFSNCFDYGFIGEADNSWSKFLQTIESNGDISKVKGILYRENGEVKSTGKSDSVTDMDSLPFPARHLLNMKNYRMMTPRGEKKFTSIITMRGCPYECVFCSTKVFGDKNRRISPKKVVEEMKECVDKYKTEHFTFLDDTLTLNRKHISDICDLIIEEKLGVTFDGNTRANLVDEELVKKMSEAGLVKLCFGLESADENVRKFLKKKVPLESYVAANKLTEKYGIETVNSCMIGLPGETEESIRNTLRFLREHKEIKQANIAIAVPYPGTELYEMAKKGENGLKLETTDFSQYKRYNAAVMSVGKFSPDDLIRIQNEAFASVYCFSPERWQTMLDKSGVEGARMTLARLMKCIDEGETKFLTNKQLGIGK